MASLPTWQKVEEVVREVVGFYGEGLRRIVDVAATGGDDVAARMLQDDLIESLLLLHGLHPDDFSSRVGKALDRVRPYLGSHGGNIELVTADERSGEVRLRLAGSCDGCPSSLLTVKLAVEGAIKELAPEVTSIEVEGVVDARAPGTGRIEPANVNHEPAWVTLGSMPELAPGKLTSTNITGADVVLCRVGESIYAYRDRCPSCGSAMDAGELSGDLLACPSCAERFDVRLAGRSIRSELHLDPLPLLEDDRGIRIALAATE